MRAQFLVLGVVMAWVGGCGSSGGTSGDLNGSGNAGGATGSGSGGSNTTIIVDLDAGTGVRNLDGAVVNFDAACATSSAAAEKLPVDLVFMMDRSDSMNKPAKYPACAVGLKAFFSDPKSRGFQASIQFFCGGGSQAKCAQDAVDWAVPAVALSPLPESVSFAQAIDAQTFCNGTPTSPALTGAINYAKSLQSANRRVAVVLVTDGLPTTCGSLSSVVAIAQANAASVPTYVIGVGTALKNLNQIAAAGGTRAAIMVTSTDPAQVAKDFEAALDIVRTGQLACDFGIPSPPAGQTLDRGKVNVSVTSGGVATALPYDRDCNAGNGWHYDDLSAPTKILLCPTACEVAKADPNTNVDVFFGCETVGIVN